MTRKLGKRLFGAAWILRPAADPARDAAAPSVRSRALEQVRDLFGGETVAGGEGGES